MQDTPNENQGTEIPEENSDGDDLDKDEDEKNNLQMLFHIEAPERDDTINKIRSRMKEDIFHQFQDLLYKKRVLSVPL